MAEINKDWFKRSCGYDPCDLNNSDFRKNLKEDLDEDINWWDGLPRMAKGLGGKKAKDAIDRLRAIRDNLEKAALEDAMDGIRSLYLDAKEKNSGLVLHKDVEKFLSAIIEEKKA